MNVNKNAFLICELLQNAGFQAVIVGGAVRDMIMGKEPNDWDIATSATPDQIEKVLHRHFIMKEVGRSFGVVLAKANDGEEFEIATFRKDVDCDGRHAVVEFGASMEEDAERRDFTINAMMFDPITEKLFDFFNGIEDISNRKIRFVGNSLMRIDEDHLRILRAIRFALRYDFSLDEHAWDCISMRPVFVTHLAQERVQDEFCKILMACKNANNLIWMFDGMGLLMYILPEVWKLKHTPQGAPWHCEGDNVLDHVILVLQNAIDMFPPSIELRLAALFHDIGKAVTVEEKENGGWRYHGHEFVGAKMTSNLMKRMKFSNEITEMVSSLVNDHMSMHQAHRFKKSTLKRFISQPNSKLLCQLGFCDALGAKHEDGTSDVAGPEFFKAALDDPSNTFPNAFITGRDLIDIGMKPNPKFKEILTKMMDFQLEGAVSSREEALLKLKEIVNGDKFN